MRHGVSRNSHNSSQGNHWLSFSDLMSALLMVFVLVMFYSVYQYLDMLEVKTAELDQQTLLLNQREEELAVRDEQLELSLARLDESQRELSQNQAQLLLAQQQLTSSQELLSSQRDEMQAQAALLDQQQQQLAQAQLALSEQQTQLSSAQALLDEQEDYIARQQQTLAQQEQRLSQQQSLMDEQQTALDALVGVRANIISDLAAKLQQANIRATVDAQTGSITLDASVLFDVGESELKPSGRNMLDSFLPVYLSVLMEGEYASSVSEIIIEGHTDTDGTYMNNLRLSQQRALSVMQYILDDSYTGITGGMKRRLRTIATANGRSFSNPIYSDDGSVDKTASRRVEFKFRLQDEQMIESMRQILEGMGE
ncbi:MAG: OmpA family protein [Clostridia bacterium]|nr:OmpA family protein [Clostridia bacterium]